MATCTVTGSVKDIASNPVTDCKIQVNIFEPFINSSGNLIISERQETTTDTSGNFSIALEQTASLTKSVEFVFLFNDGALGQKRQTYSVVIPVTTSIAFKDLL